MDCLNLAKQSNKVLVKKNNNLRIHVMINVRLKISLLPNRFFDYCIPWLKPMSVSKVCCKLRYCWLVFSV